MSDLFPFRTKHLVLGSALLLIAIVGGCRSSKQTTFSEDSFGPLDSINRTAGPKSPKIAEAQKLAPWNRLVDSLVMRQREQERRIGALTEQLQLLETYRKDKKADSSRVAINQPNRSSRPNVRRAPDRYEEILRQFKAASEKFQALQQKGVPKDIEDQVQFAVGMAKRVDSLQFIVVHDAQLIRRDLDSNAIWIYVMMGVIIIASIVIYGAFNQARRQRKDLEKKVFRVLSFSFFELEAKIKQVESDIGSHAPPKQSAAPKKSKPSIE